MLTPNRLRHGAAEPERRPGPPPPAAVQYLLQPVVGGAARADPVLGGGGRVAPRGLHGAVGFDRAVPAEAVPAVDALLAGGHRRAAAALADAGHHREDDQGRAARAHDELRPI